MFLQPYYSLLNSSSLKLVMFAMILTSIIELQLTS